MAMIHSTTADAFTPTDIGDLVDLAVKAKAVAARTGTVFSTDKVKVVFPKWVSDPAVGWYNELDTIATTDGTTGEVPCIPTKTAGITRISNELAEDSTPAAADLIGAGLANKIALAIDAAYLGNTTAKGPDGLLSIDYSTIDTGAALANLDPFVAARYAAIAAGSELTSWIVSPATAEAISKLKVATGSNQSLLQFVEDGIVVAGLPVIVSNQIDAATKFWGIPEEHTMLVMRKGTEVRRFDAVHNDGIDVRAVARLGLAFLNESGIVRGYDAS
ncbi:phage major capsid protein [Nocardia lasii]|uniref:Phage major capsid protein n=1 Tax=Nocardia lasii TaxID=1616107 RepID=A0ABW1JKX2_9NOCA